MAVSSLASLVVLTGIPALASAAALGKLTIELVSGTTISLILDLVFVLNLASVSILVVASTLASLVVLAGIPALASAAALGKLTISRTSLAISSNVVFI